MIYILRNIEEDTGDECVDEDECRFLHVESISESPEKARKIPQSRGIF